MTAALLALLAGGGTYLLATAGLLGWRHLRSPRLRRPRQRPGRVADALAQAGMVDVAPRHLVAVLGGSMLAGTAVGAAVFAAPVPALASGALTATAPMAVHRRRRAARLADAQDAWPRLLEELRILTTAAGRSVPQALADVGTRAPASLRPAFAAAHRTWLLTTDFERTLATLKAQLADPTCDAACETLLVAHELGGTDLDRRLAALAEDRRLDAQHRKDARARQAGVRFARRFVLVVPLGMAVAGLSVGTGRQAYATPAGQAAVLVGVALTGACWWWSGRILRLPRERRVFAP